MTRRICMPAALLATGVMLAVAVPAEAQQKSEQSVTTSPVKAPGKVLRPEMQYLKGVEPLTLSPAQKRTLVAQRAAAKAALRRE